MALPRTWIVISVASILFLVVVALAYRSMRPRTTYSPGTLHEDETDSETEHTYKSVSFQEDRDEGRVIDENRRKDSDAQVDTVDAMHKRLVVLTAFSSNHFPEALDMIGSMQTYLPHSKIIAYDIGLAPEERGNVSKFCSVELRSFNFSKYPPHVKMNINNYSWKPLITQELVDQGYDVIFFGDSSLRITADITPGLQCLLDFPFLDMKMETHSTISVTHDKMIEYFHFPPSRKYMAHWATIQSGGWLLYVNDITREKLIPQWTDCALHKECIAPEGAVKGPCNFALNARNDGTYVGCHRYDQSALDIILAKNFGLNVWSKVVRMGITSHLAYVARRPENIYEVKRYPHCNDTVVPK